MCEVVFIEFLTELYQVIPVEIKWLFLILMVLVFVGRVIAEVYSAIKTKGLSGAIEVLLEVNGLKKNKKYVQDFTDANIKKEYRLNRETNELIETGGTIDTQKQIESYRETSLESMLEKFMPVETAEQVAISTHSRMTDKLDELAKLVDVANGYREELGLDSNVSISEIYSIVGKKRDELNINIENYKKAVAEVNSNEKKIEQTQE